MKQLTKEICQECLQCEGCAYLIRGLEEKCVNIEWFSDGYEKAVEKACEWLKNHIEDYVYPKYKGEELTDEVSVSDTLYTDFRKAMEEQ